MLNPDLKLNQQFFEETVETKATRDGFGEAMVLLGEKNRDILALSADLKESTMLNDFAEKFPDRYFECGVAENNMVGIATGLAISGKIPFISSFAVFCPGKTWETVRTLIAYDNSNVKIAGHHAGIITGPDGATHQATEDIAIIRCLPNMTIFSACDSIQAKKATLKAGQIKGPVYLRFAREKSPVITTENTPFEDMQTFWVSENPDVTIFSTGPLLYQALIAAKNLEEKGVDTLVVNVSIIKPLNEEKVVNLSKESKAVVTVEDHQITGGLGSGIAECLAKHNPLPIEFVGLKDTFAESGQAKDLLRKYEMDNLTIREAINRVILRKT